MQEGDEEVAVDQLISTPLLCDKPGRLAAGYKGRWHVQVFHSRDTVFP